MNTSVPHLAERALRMGFTVKEVVGCETSDELRDLLMIKPAQPCVCSQHRHRHLQCRCDVCGEITYGYASEYIPRIWMYRRSYHSRVAWFRRMATAHVWQSRNAGVLTDDFSTVWVAIKTHNLLKGRGTFQGMAII